MKYLAILSLIIFIIAACHDKSTRAIRSGKAANILIGSKKVADSVTWHLSLTYDPYDGGKTYAANEENPKYLIMKRDGSFREFDNYNQSSGHWYLNKLRDKFAMVYENRNNQEIENQDMQFRYQVEKNTRDTLILGIQGRHGMMQQIYTRVTPDSLTNEEVSEHFLTDSINYATDSTQSIIPDSTVNADTTRSAGPDSLMRDTTIWQMESIGDSADMDSTRKDSLSKTD